MRAHSARAHTLTVIVAHIQVESGAEAQEVPESGSVAGSTESSQILIRLRLAGHYQAMVVDPDPNPDLIGRIRRSRKIFTGSGSYRCFGNVKLYKQEKNILKIEVLHIFR